MKIVRYVTIPCSNDHGTQNYKYLINLCFMYIFSAFYNEHNKAGRDNVETVEQAIALVNKLGSVKERKGVCVTTQPQ